MEPAYPLSHPVISLSRIDSYDGEHVTFHYNRHEDNVYVEKTLPAIDFIKLLILHIPEWNFKMTRYYGLYARNREKDSSLKKAVPKSKHTLLKSLIYYNHRRVSLEELYERTMAKARCRSS